MHYIGNAKKIMRDQRKDRAASRRAAAPLKPATPAAAAQARPRVLTPADVIPSWMRAAAGGLRVLEQSELLEAVAPAIAAELARATPAVDAAVSRFAQLRPHDDAVAFRYQILLGSAAKAIERAVARVRVGQRFVRAGQGLIVQVRIDRAAVEALYELHEGCRALQAQYLAWARSQPPPAPPSLLAGAAAVEAVFRQRVTHRCRALRALERPARFRQVQDA